MNVKGIMPNIDSNFATKKIESKKVFVAKQDEIDLSTKKEKDDFKTKSKAFFQKLKTISRKIIGCGPQKGSSNIHTGIFLEVSISSLF